MRLFALLLLVFISTATSTKAQTSKKDTLYYLIDTANTPVNDRMFYIEIHGSAEYTEIACRILKENSRPRFYSNMLKKSNVNKTKIDSVNLLRLSSLLDLLVTEQEKFNDNHVLFFLYPNGEAYTMNRAYFQPILIYNSDTMPIITPKRKSN